MKRRFLTFCVTTISVTNVSATPFYQAPAVQNAPPQSSKTSFKATLHADLDNNGRLETIDVDASCNRSLQVRDARGKVLWRGMQRRVRPWCVQIGDVDGDGKLEIAVGVWKSTRFFPAPHNCLSIYGWNGRACYPKWLGSGLSQPFTEFVLARLNRSRSDCLLALERNGDGRFSVAIYAWNYFGFVLQRRVGNWKTARDLAVNRGGVWVEADGARRAVASNVDISASRGTR